MRRSLLRDPASLMPSAMNANRTVQSASPDVGSAPGSMGNFALGGQSEVLKQVLCVIDKKVRNMEKKKSRLDEYQGRKNKGERLNQDQLEAISKYQEVMNNLEFARELQKTFFTLGQDIQKVVKKSARREQLQREEAEQRRLKTILELQFVLDRLGDDTVRQDLKQGVGGSPLLSDADLTAFDEFYKLVGPDRDQNVRLAVQYEEASVHLWDLLEGRDKAVVGTTYKALKEILDQVLLSGYFDRVPSHQNGVCEEEEEEEPVAAAVAELSEPEEQTIDQETEIIEEFTEPIAVETTEFVNRQFIPDSTYSGSEKEQGDEWTTETEAVNAMQQPMQSAAPPVALETHPMSLASPVPPTDPIVRKQVVQDLMAQMQGTYNFMQDSMLEFDGQPIDPAIVSAQPMKPAQNMDLPQMVCPQVHPESRLSQPNTVPVQPEPTQVPIVSPTPPPMYQTSHTPDPRPSTESIDPVQTSLSLSSEQPPPSTALHPASQTQVFQPVSKAPHSSGINVNAAPFQSMQTVFNLNAPVPPNNETEPLNPGSQYQNSYNQAFNNQSQHTVEQTEMQTEQLQSGGQIGAFHSQDTSGGHQQPSQQSPGFGRQAQSFYNSRGMSRGGPRNARGMINGYRGSSNGFRGGYDGYRPPFANTPNSGYGQTQFNTPRDYSNGNYQRDGYQQNYKRGAGQGPRGVSRGSIQAMRS
ncbi:Caprin-1 Cytoplasmic activation- and proliferation-associated protein 1 [Channa argus]|uniref:Caprin-1 Cytoplasmic activation-and proliferation-associated protein 1 n=1 Tax=Channa argus TaxID=215402 RepID=A0A6G1PEP1_CHAAH|nr:Caprin-1 Cytoplasmic activation- and proliferation-associated protein 1 [Channa argus]